MFHSIDYEVMICKKQNTKKNSFLFGIALYWQIGFGMPIVENLNEKSVNDGIKLLRLLSKSCIIFVL